MGAQGKTESKKALTNLPIEEIIKSWPQEPRELAKKLLEYYEEPDEFSSSQIIWLSTKDGWKRTVLTSEEIPHNFPAPHTDFLEQVINYKVPVKMHSKLAEFNGSVIAERTKGELSARSGGVEMNFVAINLAHDIVTGEKTVKEAREELTYLYKVFQDGERLAYAQNFQFDLPKANTADPDMATL